MLIEKLDLNKYLTVQSLVALVSGIVFLVGTVLGVHAYFAKEKEFVAFKDKEFVAFKCYIESRVAGADVNVLLLETGTQKSTVQGKIWQTEDRIQSKPSDYDAKKRLRELEDEKAKLDRREQELKAEKAKLLEQQKGK